VQRVERLAIGLVLVAGLADAAGAHSLAFYLLVLAVPAIAAAALAALGAAFEPGAGPAVGRAWIQASALLLVLVSAAARAPVRDEGVPRLALSALVASVLLYAGVVAVAAWPHVRRRLLTHPLARELMRS
jgi:hypothetical protein